MVDIPVTAKRPNMMKAGTTDFGLIFSSNGNSTFESLLLIFRKKKGCCLKDSKGQTELKVVMI